MANTYSLIQSYTLGSDTAGGITFSTIPNTYTHLIVNFCARDTRTSYADDLRIQINGNSGSYSNVRLYATGAGTGQDGGTGVNNTYFGFIAGSTATSNVFGNGEMIFPNYISGTAKNGISNSGIVNTVTNFQLGDNSIMSPVTSAITSITLTGYNASSGTLSAGSTLFLYGLKSS